MLMSEKGISLIELIIAIVIIAILAGFISSMIFYEINTFKFIVSRKENLQNSRMAVQMISRDLRQIISPDSILQASLDSLQFYDVNDELILYNHINNQILRNGDPIVNAVNQFQFTYYDDSGNSLSVPVNDPAEIQCISLILTTVKNDQSLMIQTKVTPRNFIQ